jgi:hypothetical protein
LRRALRRPRPERRTSPCRRPSPNCRSRPSRRSRWRRRTPPRTALRPRRCGPSERASSAASGPDAYAPTVPKSRFALPVSIGRAARTNPDITRGGGATTEACPNPQWTVRRCIGSPSGAFGPFNGVRSSSDSRWNRGSRDVADDGPNACPIRRAHRRENRVGAGTQGAVQPHLPQPGVLDHTLPGAPEADQRRRAHPGAPVGTMSGSLVIIIGLFAASCRVHGR